MVPSIFVKTVGRLSVRNFLSMCKSIFNKMINLPLEKLVVVISSTCPYLRSSRDWNLLIIIPKVAVDHCFVCLCDKMFFKIFYYIFSLFFFSSEGKKILQGSVELNATKRHRIKANMWAFKSN